MAEPDPNNATGQRLQERFEFYLVALTFTLLGLAAQTATFDELIAADLAELVAWGALLFSGLRGLARLEKMAFIYELFSRQSEQESYLTQLRRMPSSVQEVVFLDDTLSRPDAISRVEGNVELVKTAIVPKEDELMALARSQRRSFAWGVTMLVVARGIPPFLGIIGRISSALP